MQFCENQVSHTAAQHMNIDISNEDHEEEVIASQTEQFLFKNFAPKLLNKKVKAVVLVMYSIWTGICVYGCMNLTTKFDASKVSQLHDKDAYTYNFFDNYHKFF